MKKVLSIITLILIVMIVFIGIFPNKTYASLLEEIRESATNFLEIGKSKNPVDQQKISDIVIPVGQVLMLAANITIAIVTAIMAIKYMTGNPEEKGKLKTQLIGLVVSTVVIFGAQMIWSLLYDFLKDF